MHIWAWPSHLHFIWNRIQTPAEIQLLPSSPSSCRPISSTLPSCSCVPCVSWNTSNSSCLCTLYFSPRNVLPFALCLMSPSLFSGFNKVHFLKETFPDPLNSKRGAHPACFPLQYHFIHTLQFLISLWAFLLSVLCTDGNFMEDRTYVFSTPFFIPLIPSKVSDTF